METKTYGTGVSDAGFMADLPRDRSSVGKSFFLCVAWPAKNSRPQIFGEHQQTCCATNQGLQKQTPLSRIEIRQHFDEEGIRVPCFNTFVERRGKPKRRLPALVYGPRRFALFPVQHPCQ
jgi:hypothetical protein